jgi:hypothetical protein
MGKASKGQRGRIGFVRPLLAGLLALLLFAAVIPDLGRVVTEPSTHRIERDWTPLLYLAGVAAFPLTMILVGAKRSRKVEIAGWCLLLVLVMLGVFKF